MDASGGFLGHARIVLKRGRARSVTPSLRQAAIELNQLQLDARHSPEARIARTRQKVAGGVVTGVTGSPPDEEPLLPPGDAAISDAAEAS